MHLQLSWRNIWRNPKRTLVILTAVIIGAWTMLAFSALSRGIMKSMLSNALNTLTGHIQIQDRAFRDDPVVENEIEDPAPLGKIIEKTLPRDARWTFRIQVPGVASNARNSEGITIVGIDPEKEGGLSFYGDNTAQGRLLSPDDPGGIVVGEALADSFETRVGRKLVLMTQGRDGDTVSRAFKIIGVFRAQMKATEKQYVFIGLPAAQKLLKIDSAVTNVCIKLADPHRLDEVTRALFERLPENLVVLGWPKLLPLLKGYISMFDSFMLLWYVVGFTAMAFGLVNTMLMAVLERTREFGLLKALGMKPVRIVWNVLIECFFLLCIGLGAGNVLGFATISALSSGIDLSFFAQGSEFFGMGNIVIPFLVAKDVLTVNAVVLVLGLFVCLYPAVKAGRIPPVEAMAHV